MRAILNYSITLALRQTQWNPTQIALYIARYAEKVRKIGVTMPIPIRAITIVFAA